MKNRILQLATAAAVSFCLTACSGSENEGGPSAAGPSAAGPSVHKKKPYWAMSGGGWRAHTVDSAFVLAMMHSGKENLAELTSDVESISCNSGSCWFISMLAYTNAFRQYMETPDAAEDYTTTGYLGRFDHLNFDDPCRGWSEPIKTLCEKWPAGQGYFAMANMGWGLNWYSIVKDIVFAPWGMNEELAGVTLNGARQDWVNGTSLVFAGSLLSQQSVLSGGIVVQDYVSTTLPGSSEPILTSTPLFLASTATTPMIQPDLFSSGDMNLTYNSTAFWTRATSPRTIAADHPTGEVPVLAAATVASAAAAISASKTGIGKLISQIWSPLSIGAGQIAFVASALAPSFRLTDDGFDLVMDRDERNSIPSSTGYKTAAGEQLVRTADGGYNDNTAVLHMLRHLYDNDLLEDFSILAFSNTNDPLLSVGAGNVANDIAGLFGIGLRDGTGQMCIGATCVSILSPQVFDSSSANTAVVEWTYEHNGATASLTTYEVSTVANSTFGVPEGRQGKLYVLTGMHPDAETAPSSHRSFAAYGDLFYAIYYGVTKHGGWAEIEQSVP